MPMPFPSLGWPVISGKVGVGLGLGYPVLGRVGNVPVVGRVGKVPGVGRVGKVPVVGRVGDTG